MSEIIKLLRLSFNLSIRMIEVLRALFALLEKIISVFLKIVLDSSAIFSILCIPLSDNGLFISSTL